MAMLDLIWFRQIVVPEFYNAPQLGDVRNRHLLHLILLSYLDKLAFEALPDTAGNILQISFEGRVETVKLASFTPNHYFDYKDVDADGNRDYIFLDNSKLSIFKNKSKYTAMPLKL